MLFAITIFAEAQTDAAKQKTVSVTGTAETEVTPDEIYVQVDLREYDKKGVGKIALDNIKNDFMAACKSVGINDSDITVEAYEGNASYWQLRHNRKKDPDLKAGISYWVKLRTTQKMDELVDKLDDEATQNFFIAKVDYSKRIELKKQLKINAIKAAKEKAVYLTDAIGEHIGGAVSITDVEDNAVSDLLYNYRANQFAYANTSARLSEKQVTDNGTDFKKIKFQFQVNVVFGLQ